MELWIMTQDRTTLISSYEIYISEQQNNYLIRSQRTSHILGSYSTFERAKEVLKEINDIKFYKYIASLNFNHFIRIIQKYNDKEQQELLLKMNTYEMPNE